MPPFPKNKGGEKKKKRKRYIEMEAPGFSKQNICNLSPKFILKKIQQDTPFYFYFFLR